MPEAEFTGERVIPGLVDANLLNEHLARYRFAARFRHGTATILDAGCGSGYGTAEFEGAASITAMDISPEAIRLARDTFGRPRISFLRAACERLPFADESFDLMTAFEVIEHLARWPELLDEARRVVRPSGVFLVSTPNKAYYAESRAAAGPNPFHCHEFEYEEFRSALYSVFPHVRIWAQNHSESIVFAPVSPSGAALDADGDPAPEHAHFFLAACSQSPIESNEVYAWMPASGNLLREREHHISKLEGELARKDVWLKRLIEDHAALQGAHETLLAELKSRSQWAERLRGQLAERDARIGDLQSEADERLAWVTDLESTIETGRQEIARLNLHREGLETDLAARAAWGESLNAELRERSRQLAESSREALALSEQLRTLYEERRLIAGSRWIRLGRKLNLGPVVTGE